MNKMESILVKIIRILIITSIPEVFCANFIQSHSDCNAKDKPIEDKRIFAHVVRNCNLYSFFIYLISILIWFLFLFFHFTDISSW